MAVSILEAAPEQGLYGGLDVIVNSDGEITVRELLEARESGRPLEQVPGITFLTGGAPISTERRVPLEDMHNSMLSLMDGFYRFRRLAGVMLHALRFPLAMLPLTNLRSRWRKWYRYWRNDVIGSVRYFIVKNWHKAFREGPFNEKLRRSTAMLKQ